MSRRALIALGVGQCVNWGVLYYAFAVLLRPLAEELRHGTWVVAGALSLALATSAALAPSVGRWCDRGHGAPVMQIGGFAAALILAIWTLTSGVIALYAVWTALGLCMAATLYEPAFVIVGRRLGDPRQRLRALAVVTLLGGLASAVFLPATAFLVARVGWRGAVLCLAALLAVSTAVTRLLVFGPAGSPPTAPYDATERVVRRAHGAAPPGMATLEATFALGTLASAGFAANLVPALDEGGISPAAVPMLGGLMGLMQLPGRAILMNEGFGLPPSRLLTISLTLHAAGLLGVAFAPSTAVAAVGVAVFALGAGLTTLVRPHLVQEMADEGGGGNLNGRMARKQQLARAAGPLLIASAAGASSYAAVMAAMAIALLGCAAGWGVFPHRRPRDNRARPLCYFRSAMKGTLPRRPPTAPSRYTCLFTPGPENTE